MRNFFQLGYYLSGMRTLLLFTVLLCCPVLFAQRDTTIYVFFKQGSYTPANSVNPLQKLDTNRWMKTVVLIGKTDTTGTPEFNRQLADWRLKTVNELIAKGKYFKVGKSIIAGEEQANLKQYIDSKERCVAIRITAKPNGKKGTSPQITTEKQDQPAVRMPKNFHPDSAMVKGDVIVLNNILFELNETIILPESYPELEQLLKVMKANPNMRIHIKGHVCCAPAMDLSTKRAQKIYSYLVRYGINDDRMTFKGYSNKSPHPLYKSDLYDSRHRRVEIEILEK